MSEQKAGPMSYQDILTSSGKYPGRAYSDECTSKVVANSSVLASRVRKLLDILGRNASVSSGFRTVDDNRKTAGAPKSAHLTGEAADLSDPDGKLAEAILTKPGVLEECDLYLENPEYTKGWVHLQTRKTKSGRRVFAP